MHTHTNMKTYNVKKFTVNWGQKLNSLVFSHFQTILNDLWRPTEYCFYDMKEESLLFLGSYDVYMSPCFWSKNQKTFVPGAPSFEPLCDLHLFSWSFHSFSLNYHDSCLNFSDLQHLAMSLSSHIFFSCPCWSIIQREHCSHLEQFTSLKLINKLHQTPPPTTEKHEWLL